MDPNDKQGVPNTSTNSNIQNIKQKSFDKFKPYYQGIICNRDQRESGKKRNMWTNIIIVILIISIVLLIISITLGSNGNNSWWVYLIFGLLGTIGCIFGHYYNTKMYIENSKYDIDLEDIKSLSNNKLEIKKTIADISKLQKDINYTKLGIKNKYMKDKSKEKISELTAKTKSGLTSFAEKSKSGLTSFAAKTKSGFTQMKENLLKKQNNNEELPNNNEVTLNNKVPPNVSSGKGEEISNDNTLESKLAELEKELVEKQTKLKQLKDDYERMNLINSYYKRIKTTNKDNLIIIYNIKDFYEDLSLLKDIKYIDINEIDVFKNSKYLEPIEQSVSSEYIKLIQDIEKLKQLKGKEIPDKISELNYNFNIQYLKTIKDNILNKYIDEFLQYINKTLIQESDINKYFNLSQNYSNIYNSFMGYPQKQKYLNDEYTKLKLTLQTKYTKQAIKEINNIPETMKSKAFNINTYNELKTKYDSYLKYELSDSFKDTYYTIMNNLVTNYTDYVFDSLKLTYHTKDLISVESINKYIENYKIDIAGADDIKKRINDYENHPIISSRPSEKNSLMTKILKPLMDKKTELEIAEAKKQEPTLLSKIWK
jgi:hypothetical protein